MVDVEQQQQSSADKPRSSKNDDFHGFALYKFKARRYITVLSQDMFLFMFNVSVFVGLIMETRKSNKTTMKKLTVECQVRVHQRRRVRTLWRIFCGKRQQLITISGKMYMFHYFPTIDL